MKALKIIFNSIDWVNVLYLSFIIFLAKYCFLYGFGFQTTFSFIDISLFAISCSFFYKATYLLRHYYNSDSKQIKPCLNTIKYTAFTFVVIALLFGFYLSFKIEKPFFSILFIVFCYLTFVYSKFAKKKSFLDSLIKSFIIPFVISCVWWLDSPINLTAKEWELFFQLQFITIVYLMLAFLGTLSEEILKDISNIDEDNYNNYKTLPILFGRKRAKNTALTLMIISNMLIILLTMYFINIKYLFYVIYISNGVPQLLVVYYTITAVNTSDYKKLLNKKMIFFKTIGIIGVVAIAYYFKYVI